MQLSLNNTTVIFRIFHNKGNLSPTSLTDEEKLNNYDEVIVFKIELK